MNRDHDDRLRLQDFLPYRLSIASNLVSNRIATAYRERFGLDIPEWRLTAMLAELGEATPQELVRSTGMDKIAVSRAASRLRARSLVIAAPNPKDGRSHFLRLSAAGIALYRQVAPLALALEAELLRSFSGEEIARFTALLKRIEAAAGEGVAPQS